MKAKRLEKPAKRAPEKAAAKDVAPRPERPSIAEQTRYACDPFEAFLEAYTQNPERWDGLE
jgi:hypothetical protein